MPLATKTTWQEKKPTCDDRRRKARTDAKCEIVIWSLAPEQQTEDVDQSSDCSLCWNTCFYHELFFTKALMLTAKLVQMNQSGFNTLVYNLLLDLLGFENGVCLSSICIRCWNFRKWVETRPPEHCCHPHNPSPTGAHLGQPIKWNACCKNVAKPFKLIQSLSLCEFSVCAIKITEDRLQVMCHRVSYVSFISWNAPVRTCEIPTCVEIRFRGTATMSIPSVTDSAESLETKASLKTWEWHGKLRPSTSKFSQKAQVIQSDTKYQGLKFFYARTAHCSF